MTLREEIEEMFAEEQGRATGFALDLYIMRGDISKHDRRAEQNVGFRFGKGNPDHCIMKLGRPKPDRRREAKPKPLHHCLRPKCGKLCYRAFCSHSCANTRGERKPQTCVVCSVVFVPPRHDSKGVCSRQCAGVRAGAAKRVERTGDGGCGICGGGLTGKQRQFCSRRCQKINTNRAYRSRLQCQPK